jgi:hypothetical protein
MRIGEWLHHLFTPHCVQCKEDYVELDRCKSCEVLEQQLAQANREKHDLLNMIMQLSQPKVEVEAKPYIPLADEARPKFIPWRVKQQELEANDRQAARILKDKHKEMADAKAAAAEKDYTVKVETSISKLEEELELELGAEQHDSK